MEHCGVELGEAESIHERRWKSLEGACPGELFKPCRVGVLRTRLDREYETGQPVDYRGCYVKMRKKLRFILTRREWSPGVSVTGRRGRTVPGRPELEDVKSSRDAQGLSMSTRTSDTAIE